MTERDGMPRVGKNKESKCKSSKSKSSSSIRTEKAAMPSASAPILVTESTDSRKVCRVGPHRNNPKAATTREGTSGDGPLSPITPSTYLEGFKVLGYAPSRGNAYRLRETTLSMEQGIGAEHSWSKQGKKYFFINTRHRLLIQKGDNGNIAIPALNLGMIRFYNHGCS
ncbi:hypothetical protein FH972_003702 [Carpinus fangiana]|uniref:Uncharacterized protein n=1 Tax=Carpinus fangiana TaxID=176857 RepID=A0A5N6QL87_9ROSI|nr:hypothetical protein FH972_003702 [Carpinus fangiana]